MMVIVIMMIMISYNNNVIITPQSNIEKFTIFQVLHVSGSNGQLLGKLKIAAEKVSSVTFGGPQLDKLYVTTISRGVEKEKFKKYPMTGKLLEVNGLGVKGTLSRRVRDKCFGSL